MDYNLLKSFRVFIAQMSDKRERARFEAAIMYQIYDSKEPWAELADRGMALSKRSKEEIPIVIKNSEKNDFILGCSSFLLK
jgi:hypothetical protein